VQGGALIRRVGLGGSCGDERDDCGCEDRRLEWFFALILH
jgi:hypothetical protein